MRKIEAEHEGARAGQGRPAGKEGPEGRLHPDHLRDADFDEPFAQRDALTRGVIQDELVRMWSASRNTVFMVTHDVDRQSCSRTVEVKLARPRRRAEPIDDPEFLRLGTHIMRFLVQGALTLRSTASGRTAMDRTAALEQIRAARVARGVSYDDLGKAIGTKDPTYLAAALHGQHRLSADEAKQLAAAVGVPVETAMATTAMPLRTDFPLTTDPFKYRLMELVGVYGDALRERCNELFGDGILSAIDCVVKLEKKGERGVLTIDAKFLHYKEY